MPWFLEYRDFSGGHFVGPVGTDQPRDTWKGEGATVSTSDGMLMPAAEIENVTPTGTTGWDGADNSRNPSNFGAPVVVTSSWHNLAGVHQVVCWAYWQGTSTYDTVFMASDGLTTQSQTVAGVVGNYMMPFGRPVGVANSSQAATVYFPMSRAPGLTGELWAYSLNNGASMAATVLASVALPARISVLDKWKEWLVGAQFGTNRLYWSDPLAPMTWPAGNFVDIGDAAPIKALVPFANQLYVGKETSWFIVTGVLGDESMVVRQMDATIGPSTAFVAPVGSGIMFDTPDFSVSFMVQNGLRTDIENYAKTQTSEHNTHAPVTVADKVIACGGGPQDFFATTIHQPTFSWVYDAGRWAKLPIPDTALPVEAWLWCKDYSHFRAEGDRYAWLYATTGSAATNAAAYLFRWKPRLADPQPGTECTVELAEARRSPAAPAGGALFTVQSVFVDVEIPPDATGAVGVDIELRMIGTVSPDIGAETTVKQSQTKIAESFNGVRTLVRWEFSVNTEVGSGVVPIVTLRGVKLRRLYMRCDDAGKV